MAKQPAKVCTIERTSPKGGPFVGHCPMCGREGMTLADMGAECPNPAGISEDEALLAALRTADTDTEGD